GTRIGLVTASNDHRVLRLTGSLPLLQKSLAGVVMSVGSFFWFFLKSSSSFSSTCLGGMRLNHAPDGPDKTAQLTAQGCRRHFRFLAAGPDQMFVALIQAALRGPGGVGHRFGQTFL